MAKIFQLTNKIRVILEFMPHFKTVTTGVWIRAGSANETKKTNGLAHMLEHMIFQGTTTRSAKEIGAITARIGDDLNAYTSEEYTAYYSTTITEDLPVLLELLSDMLFHPKFGIQEIRKEKKVILEEIDMYEDSPEDLVHELLQKKIFGSHPLGFSISGTKERVKQFQKEDLFQFWNTYYVPERMVISIAGAFCEEEILVKLEELFGKEKMGKNTHTISEEKIPSPILHQSICLRKKDIEQLYINLAVPAIYVGHKDMVSFSVVNSVLGGSNHSRLFQKVREELGLAYSIYSYGNSFSNVGLWHIDSTVNPSKGAYCLQIILDIIHNLSKKGLTKEELEMHKRQIMIETILSDEGTKARMSKQARNIFIYGRVIPLKEWLDNLKNVTLSQVNEFAASYLKLDQLSLCLIGPKGQTDGLEKLKRQFKKWTNIS